MPLCLLVFDPLVDRSFEAKVFRPVNEMFASHTSDFPP